MPFRHQRKLKGYKKSGKVSSGSDTEEHGFPWRWSSGPELPSPGTHVPCGSSSPPGTVKVTESPRGLGWGMQPVSLAGVGEE